jgi:hypothetical protein
VAPSAVEVAVGRRFGRLEVLDASIHVQSGRQRPRGALVRCDCGETREVVLGSLLRGATQSCGCLNAENRRRPRPMARKHTVAEGDVFGSLTVIDPDRGIAQSSRVIGVRCKCGTETEVLLSNLVRGTVRSCGCLRYEQVVWDRSDPDWRWRQYLWTQYRITPERYLAMLEAQNGVCGICRKPPGAKRLHVDHDHACCPQSGRSCGECVRGLLCFRCNTTTGVLEMHRAAIDAYLGRGPV